MAKGYIPLGPLAADDIFPPEAEERRHGAQARKTRWSPYLILLLIVSIATNLVALFIWQGPSSKIPEPAAFAKGKEIPTVYKPIWWNTEYSSPNYTEQDALWDAILPSHGFIAIDRHRAARQNWPASMHLPADGSKGVYLLEAYHQLHCLRILRKTMGEALTGQPFTWKPGAHIEHCFDHLLQIATCHADSTPLYTFGDNTAGDGQLHACRDWAALRAYAAEHSACYRDTVEDVLLAEHFGYCDDGRDGVIDAGRVEVAIP